MKGEEKHGDEKIQYLQMIQNIIDRMSTTSAIFKGFCANIVAGVFAFYLFITIKLLLLIFYIYYIIFFTFFDLSLLYIFRQKSIFQIYHLTLIHHPAPF